MNFKKFWEKHGSQAALVFICLCFILIVGTGGKNLLERYKTNAQITNALNEADASKTVHVYVRGSAVSEGALTLPAGSTVEDAIKAAGGLADDADESGIDFSAPLEEGQEISISSKENADMQININTADVKELQKLPGIGESYAERIIAYREMYGGFKNINEIKKVRGIGTKKFEQIKELIRIN